MAGQAVLVTGATGTIGSWIATEALRRGLRVVAMVRGDEPHLARRRVLAALASAGAEASARQVEVVLGDLCREGLGLGGEVSAAPSKANLHDVSLICHCAADVRFDDGQSDLRRQTNVDGTAAVLALASRLGASVMHLSTAYVAGTRRGLVREEELDTGQRFNNGYERSKCQAEIIVRDWSLSTGLPSLILRPGIVLGDWTTGRTIHFNALYHFLRFFDRTSAGREDAAFRVQARPDATMNIVPVDYVARAAWDLAQAGAVGTFHVTHPNPVPLDKLSGMFHDLFGGVRIRLVGTEEFARPAPTRLEQALSSMAESYQPYMQSEPVFERANIDAALGNCPPPVIDTAYLRRLVEYARLVDWGKDAAPVEAVARVSAESAGRGAASGPPPVAPTAPVGFERYFGEFLPGKTDQRLLPDLHTLCATFSVSSCEAPGIHWSVEIRQGVLTGITRNGSTCECSYLIDEPTLLSVVAGKPTPQDAFFQRRVEIDGDLETGLRVAFVLASFFRTFPFTMTEQASAADR